jgi:hypothetical protein
VCHPAPFGIVHSHAAVRWYMLYGKTSLKHRLLWCYLTSAIRASLSRAKQPAHHEFLSLAPSMFFVDLYISRSFGLFFQGLSRLTPEPTPTALPPSF